MHNFNFTMILPRRTALVLLMVAMAVTAAMAGEGWPFKARKFYDIFPNQYQLHDDIYDFTVYHAEAPGAKPELWPGAKLSGITLFDDPMTLTGTIVVGLTLDLSTTDQNYQTIGQLSFDGPCDKVCVLFFDDTPMITDGEGAVEIYTFPGGWFQPASKSMKVTLFISLPDNDFLTFMRSDAKAIIPAITELSEWVEEPIVASLVIDKPQPIIRYTLLDMGIDAGLLSGAQSQQSAQQPQPPISSKPLDARGYQYIDLGLPSGTLWASCNIGAENPEKPGTYFSWGEIAGKTTFPSDIDTYYNRERLFAKGYIDASGVLVPAHDAAQAQWGGSWRMPTEEEVKELLDNCDVTCPYANLGNMRDCYLFKSRINGKELVIPKSGYKSSSYHDYEVFSYFWTSTVYDGGEAKAATLAGGEPKVITDYIYHGMPIRPVMGPAK